ncbi:MAG: AAA family ATPase [Burkholderiaceae bacterium]|nr:AAA family ATPase [Burkholderiaceae bacterium]
MRFMRIAQWYQAPAAVEQAVRALAAQRAGGARAMLITGAPGTGKTALAEALAEGSGAPLIYALLHPWSGADDLFAGVNVPAAVAGDAERVHQPGVLALVAEASQRHELVVLCLDEVDKASEATEALLLDWLQSGRVPVRPGEHLQTRLDRVLVIITSNGARPHTDALLRRCRRLRMQPLADDLRVRLAAERSGAPAGVCRLIDRAACAGARAEGNEALSLQEIAHACAEAWAVADSAESVTETLRAWAARTEEGAAAVDGPEVRRLVAAIWGEIAAARRRGR